MKESLEELIVENANLIYKIANMFRNSNCDMEDFSAILNENLLNQVKEFANKKCWKNNFLNTRASSINKSWFKRNTLP